MVQKKKKKVALLELLGKSLQLATKPTMQSEPQHANAT